MRRTQLFFYVRLLTAVNGWVTLRSEKPLKTVNYPVTSSADEWGNELLLLDQVIVEGFESKYLRQKAIDLGRTPDVSSHH